MVDTQWMIYGAYGYTGVLLAEEAIRRGHRPLLAGRSAAKLRPLAERLDLPWRVVSLDDESALTEAVTDVQAVIHAAGPFSQTAAPMVRACLAGITNYLDITGEIAVFDHIFSQDQAAYEREIALIPGVGFDVVPTDCLANYVAAQIPNPQTLDIAFAALNGISPGTGKTSLEGFLGSTQIRRGGVLQTHPLGQDTRRVRFADAERLTVAIPWGDLATAYRSTGIPNITAYMATTPSMVQMMRWIGPIQGLLSRPPLKPLAAWIIERTLHGPDETARREQRSHVWARANNASGQQAEAWLETAEAYQLTAVAGISALERVLNERPRGALTPAQAFGADFVLDIEHTVRYDTLPD